VSAGDSDGGHGSGGSSSRSRGVTQVRSSSTKSRTSSTSKTKAKPKAKPAASRKHTVTGKDSLWSISRKYGTTVDKIKAANGLKSDILRDGRVLVIPR
jgi:LysM repeat protein